MVRCINFPSRYDEELYNLTKHVNDYQEEVDKIARRREMAKHSSYNSEEFVKNLTEDEPTAITSLRKANINLTYFNTFTRDDWKFNSKIIKGNNTLIRKWCLSELKYKPYSKLAVGGTLYIFRDDTDAMAAYLRWST